MLPMGDKKKSKVDKARGIFNDKDIIFEEKPNGQFMIDKANFWATSDKWYDPMTGSKGVGINSFIKYLKDNNII